MQLDSIVYDYTSLQGAITETLNNESPTFQAMYPSDTATSLVNVLASYGSMLQYQLVSAMANMYTDSAYSETGIRQLAETLGNKLHGNISSQVYCTIERLNLKNTTKIMIPAGSKFMAGDLNFFNPEDILFSINSNTVKSVKLIQGELQTVEFTASGISGEKLYFCEDFKCNTNLVRVFVDDVEWSIADSFLPYVVSDDSTDNETTVVIVHTDGDGRTYVKFGNNSNGRIPAKGTIIKVEYVTNEGADGNINNDDVEIKLITPIYYDDNTKKRVQLQVQITATSTVSGGFNTQSIETLRDSSPYVFASGDRCVRREDYKAMLLNKCGYLTTNVWGEYEEAIINGGYDKIMMNMVYYTGIKSIQKYDLFPILNAIDLDPTNLPNDNFYHFDGSIASANGFLGSYVIELRSYDSQNAPISVKYVDTMGTGILTCDPTANTTLTTASSNPHYIEEKIFPCNDIINDSNIRIAINQDATEEGQRAVDLLTGNFVKSTGTRNGQPMLINYTNPFQIRIQAIDTDECIAGFAFKTPKETSDFKAFPYKLAIYATKNDMDINDDTNYTNIKNNSGWAKLSGIQMISNSQIGSDQWTDWFTTSVYNPGKKQSYELSFHMEESDYAQNVEERWWGYITNTPDTHLTVLNITNPDLYTTKDLEYTLKIGNEIIPTTSDSVEFINNQVHIKNRILSLEEINKTVLYGTLVDWGRYKNYVIEIYALQDTTSSIPKKEVAIQQIKAIYKNSASYINYDTNFAYIKLPIVTENGTKTLCFPEDMQFYDYSVTLNGITQANGYVNGDILTYLIEAGIYTLDFTVEVLSVSSQLFKVTVTPRSGKYANIPTEILKGKLPIKIEDQPLLHNGTIVSNATISISSSSILDMYANYTGNYYTNADIQAADLPILNKYNHFTTYMEFKQPHLKNLNIEIDLEYDDVTNYQTTKTNVINAINALFELQPYSMGATCNVSDIWKAVNSVQGVKRFNVLNPVNNIDCMPYEVFNLPAENLIINDIFNSEFK